MFTFIALLTAHIDSSQLMDITLHSVRALI
jgi:hypothetical protein